MSQPTATDDDLHSDSALEPTRSTPEGDRRLRWGAALVGLSGLGFVGNGLSMLYRAFYSAGFEAGVDTLGGVTRAELAASNHELAHYVHHLHVNVAGLMVAAGIAIVALAWFGIRRGQRWALATAVAVPAVFLLHSLPAHQAAEFPFDALVHLGPGAMWLPALVVGAVLAHRGLDRGEGSADPYRHDD